MARVLQKLKNTGGILVADVAGHDFTDAARAARLHQAFEGARYEMDLNGQITLRLFEQINTRFCKSSTLRNLAAGPDEASYVTLIYGEISNTGRFSFVSAGHPPPLVFSREFDRFVEVSQDRLISYPPIGLQPGEHHADAKRYERALGYKKRYTVNNLNLMGHGDVLLLYTDGLIEPLSDYTQDQPAHAGRGPKRHRADDLRSHRAPSPGHRPRRPTTSRSSSSSIADSAARAPRTADSRGRQRRYPRRAVTRPDRPLSVTCSGCQPAASTPRGM